MLPAFNRRSIRYHGYDYTQPGAYFVTIVTNHRVCMFGEIVNDDMRLNRFGKIVAQAWEWLAQQYPYVGVEPYVVMPNHFHGVLHVNSVDGVCRGGSRPAPTNNDKTKPLGQLIGAFKTRSAKQINLERCMQGSAIWQRGYYEHIIRNLEELENIGKYILFNPVQWSDDPDNINQPTT